MGHRLCLHFGRSQGKIVVLHFANYVWMVTSEVVHVLQAMRLQDGHRDPLRSSASSQYNLCSSSRQRLWIPADHGTSCGSGCWTSKDRGVHPAGTRLATHEPLHW